MPKLIFDLQKAKEFVKKNNLKTIIIQIPEGLKTQATEICDEFSFCENVFTKTDPCFGACDLPLHDKNVLNADCIVHIGHTGIHSNKNIVYVPLHYEISIEETEAMGKKIVKELQKNKIDSVALIANAQYLSVLPELKKILFKNEIKSFVGKGSERISYEGQILGCNYSVVESIESAVQATVYFGDGYFHPIGLVYSTKKKVFVANPLSKKVEEISEKRDRLLRKRYGAIARASDAKRFGIIVSTKSGQRRKELALELKKAIERKGKKAYLLECDLINESYFIGIDVDCLVNTACNRIVLDDAENWKKLIINPTECLIAIDEKSWKEWIPDELER